MERMDRAVRIFEVPVSKGYALVSLLLIPFRTQAELLLEQKYKKRFIVPITQVGLHVRSATPVTITRCREYYYCNKKTSVVPEIGFVALVEKKILRNIT